MADEFEEDAAAVVGGFGDVECGARGRGDGDGEAEAGDGVGELFCVGELGVEKLHAAELFGPVGAGVVGGVMGEGDGFFLAEVTGGEGDAGAGPVFVEACDDQVGGDGAEEVEGAEGVGLPGVDDEGIGGHGEKLKMQNAKLKTQNAKPWSHSSVSMRD